MLQPRHQLRNLSSALTFGVGRGQNIGLYAKTEAETNEYSVAFNANKSKCLVVQPRQNRGLPLLNLPTLNFRVGGNDIEIASEWPHLGHIISSHCLDDGDIFYRRNCMIGQVNSVLCHFGKLPSSVKSKLLYAYCSSLYHHSLLRQTGSTKSKKQKNTKYKYTIRTYKKQRTTT